VLSQSPERNLQHVYASHPDHLAAGAAALAELAGWPYGMLAEAFLRVEAV
jgi:hypothetical protein